MEIQTNNCLVMVKRDNKNNGHIEKCDRMAHDRATEIVFWF